MQKKDVKLLIIVAIALTSISCSLTQCSGRRSISNNEAEIQSQETAQADITSEATQEDFHPGRILYSDAGGLYFFDLQTFQSSQVGAGDIRGGIISPDGQYLAYLTNSDDPDSWKISDLSVLVLETGELLNTSAFPEDANTYIWSTEPDVITFTRRNWDYCLEFVDRQISGLYQYNVRNNEISELYVESDEYAYYVEAWSPDGRYLLYSYAPDCTEGIGLSIYNPQTRDITGLGYADASWSPDGSHLAVSNIWYWEPEDLPLIQYNVGTGEQVELFFKPGYYVSSPVWSPDGTWIAFTVSSTENDDFQSILLDHATGEIREIPLDSAQPVFWIADSNSLILTVTKDDLTRDVYLYNLDSLDLIQILDGITGHPIQWIQ